MLIKVREIEGLDQTRCQICAVEFCMPEPAHGRPSLDVPYLWPMRTCVGNRGKEPNRCLFVRGPPKIEVVMLALVVLLAFLQSHNKLGTDSTKQKEKAKRRALASSVAFCSPLKA